MEPQEIEQDIIGMIVNHPRICETYIQSLRAEDFKDGRHRLILNAAISLCSLSGIAPLDFFLLLEHVIGNGVLSDCGGLAYLVELADRTASRTTDDFPAHIESMLTRNAQKSIPADR
jgi:replicative DNA helicase